MTGKFEFVDDTGYGVWDDNTGLSFADESQRKQIPDAYMQALKQAAQDVANKIKSAKGN